MEPQDTFALSRRGEAKRQQGDFAGAIADFDLVLQLEPDAFALSRRGEAKRQQEDFAGAIACLDLALQLEPQDAFSLSRRGEAKRQQGDFVGAIPYFDRALDLDHRHVFALCRRGEARRQQGDDAGAIADFNLAVQMEPDNSFALSRRGEAKRQQEEYAGAIACLDLALQLEPKDEFALSSRGEAKRQQEDFAGAIADFDLVLQLEPEDAFALSRRGEAKRQQGDFAGAIADFDLVLELEPDAFALSRRGEAKRQQGDFAGAIADFDLVLELEPDAFALSRRGEAKRQQGGNAGAIVDFDSALQLEPRNAFALSRRGEAKRQQKKFVGAIADLDLTLQLEPSNSFASECRAKVETAKASRWFVQKADSLVPLQSCQMSQQLKWAIVGAGPVGLTLAVSLAEAMHSQGLDPEVACIDIYETRWIRWSDEGNAWRRNLEERLLQKVQQVPYNKYVRIHQIDPLPNEQEQAEWIETLHADLVVAADGASSLSRRAFPDAFVNPVDVFGKSDAQQVCLGDTADDLDEVDYALGIALKPDYRPPQKQALNVIFTLAQNVYLLNSQEGSRGYLNIRITKEEYDAIFEATGKKGCPFGRPIVLFIEEDLLRPSYAQCFYHVLPAAKKVLLLAGDAAISHHFWPGRGLNTGLKSALAIVKMWQRCEAGLITLCGLGSH
eukprot:Skav231134  [mRNA]  locus=scaffold992:144842:148951:+ [translate_table: standard]